VISRYCTHFPWSWPDHGPKRAVNNAVKRQRCVLKQASGVQSSCWWIVILRLKVNQSHYRPGQAQRVLRKLRFPDFVTTAQDSGRLSALRTGSLYPQEILLVLISVRGWFDPKAIVRSEGFCVNEKSGIEPATFWFVAQHLNHCATAIPHS